MKENYIREPREPSMPKIKGKIGETSIEEGIRYARDILTKDPEIKQEPIMQKADHVGSFHLLKETQKGDKTKEGNKKNNVVEVKNGDRVEKGQIVGYLRYLGIEDKVCAKYNGIISNLPEEGVQMGYKDELFTITPTPEK